MPAAQRLYGYYVLPFLLGDRFAARVDLKADRKAGVLQVPAAWIEPAADQDETAAALALELRRLAGWLGLSRSPRRSGATWPSRCRPRCRRVPRVYRDGHDQRAPRSPKPRARTRRCPWPAYPTRRRPSPTG